MRERRRGSVEKPDCAVVVKPDQASWDGVLKEVRNEELHPAGFEVFQDKETPIAWTTVTEIADPVFAF